MAKKQYIRKTHWVRKKYVYWPEAWVKPGFRNIYDLRYSYHWHKRLDWSKKRIAIYDWYAVCGNSAGLDDMTIFRKKVTCKSCLRIMNNGKK